MARKIVQIRTDDGDGDRALIAMTIREMVILMLMATVMVLLVVRTMKVMSIEIQGHGGVVRGAENK
jgi:competence protein ComGC